MHTLYDSILSHVVLHRIAVNLGIVVKTEVPLSDIHVIWSLSYYTHKCQRKIKDLPIDLRK